MHDLPEFRRRVRELAEQLETLARKVRQTQRFVVDLDTREQQALTQLDERLTQAATLLKETL